MPDPPPSGQGPGVNVGQNLNPTSALGMPVTLTPVRDSKAQGVSKKINQMTYHEILNRANDNVLEITTQMIDPPQNATLVEKSLTFDDFADFLFDHLKVNPDDCSSYTFSQYSNNSKELKFKPSVDISPYIGSFSFRGHSFTSRRQGNRTVRVTFREVPHYICDEELLNIVQCYGTPTDFVMHYDQSANPKAKGLVNVSTRHMEMTMGDKKVPNYFWLEGAHPGDKSVRITVTHPGQEPQCYNCLCSGSACPGQGKGKACKSSNTPKARMDQYMQRLKVQHGYVSLKAKHAVSFPNLGGRKPALVFNDQIPSVEEEKDKLISELQAKVEAMMEAEKERKEQEGLAESQIEYETRIETERRLRAEAELKLSNARSLQVELVEEGYTRESLKECSQLLKPEVLNCLQQYMDDENGEVSFDRVVSMVVSSAYLPEFTLSADESTVIPPPDFLEHSNLSEGYEEKLSNVKTSALEVIFKKKKDISKQCENNLNTSLMLRERLFGRNKRKSESQPEDNESNSLAPARKRSSSLSVRLPPLPPLVLSSAPPAQPVFSPISPASPPPALGNPPPSEEPSSSPKPSSEVAAVSLPSSHPSTLS